MMYALTFDGWEDYLQPLPREMALIAEENFWDLVIISPPAKEANDDARD